MLRKSKAMTDDVTRSSGNVFADLGLPNSEEELIKARLVVELRNLIEERGISQTAAAKLMGVAQPDLSKLLKGRVAGFSLDRLLGFVCALGADVEIKLKPSRANREGHMRLMVA
jgi:predicted XRE-type DNA-binding protein